MKEGYPALHWAIKNSNYFFFFFSFSFITLILNCLKIQFTHSEMDKVVQLLIQNGADVNIVDSQGTTALHIATATGKFLRFQCCFFLLFQLQNSLKFSVEWLKKLKTYRIYSDNLEIAELLINNGANLKQKNSDRETPLHFAARYGNC